MNTEHCSICRIIRTALLSVLLGAAAGYFVLDVSGSVDLSMTATFMGAIVPILWHARQNRVRREGSK